MTIEFNCPKCNAVIAFADQHAGKNAHCAACKEHFVIPTKSFDKVEIIKPVEINVPIEGFYRAVFIDSWKIFLRRENVTGLVFVIAAVSFKFFTGHVDYSWEMANYRFQAPWGLIITLVCWGCLFWYYMETIRQAALDYDEMPEVDMGDFFGFIWNTAKSLYLFFMVFFAVELPAIIAHKLSDNVYLFAILSTIGFCFFPVGILTISIVGDLISVFNPVNILKPVIKAFWPYFVVASLFVVTCHLEIVNVEYGSLIGKSKLVIGLNLSANIAIQMLAIFTMRSIGLFYRHYVCYFKS